MRDDFQYDRTRGGGESHYKTLTWSHDVLWWPSQKDEYSISPITYHRRNDDHWVFSQSRTCAVEGEKHEHMGHHKVASRNRERKLMGFVRIPVE